eukprot:gene6501-6259_t
MCSLALRSAMDEAHAEAARLLDLITSGASSFEDTARKFYPALHCSYQLPAYTSLLYACAAPVPLFHLELLLAILSDCTSADFGGDLGELTSLPI